MARGKRIATRRSGAGLSRRAYAAHLRTSQLASIFRSIGNLVDFTYGFEAVLAIPTMVVTIGATVHV